VLGLPAEEERITMNTNSCCNLCSHLCK